jgi:uncharacterized protein YbgA (DUF1722 family)/uncharacterized protein YbbK (DUF523 family)
LTLSFSPCYTFMEIRTRDNKEVGNVVAKRVQLSRLIESPVMEPKMKIGISACLLGEKVRYDGGHKWDRYLTDTMGKYVEYVPVCPEVECGFSVPREPFRLVGDPVSPRLVTVHSRQDHTERMLSWSRKRVAELEQEDLCGFIFKSGSPSSGMARVKVYDGNNVPVKRGVGIFAGVFMEHFPLLPVEDEGRLHDPRLRENFVESIFALKRFRDLLAQKPSRGKLVDFHTRHKLLLLSHSPKLHGMMGVLLAHARDYPIKDLYDRYQHLFLNALKLKTTVKKHTNVLFHMAGYFKDLLSGEEKQELSETIHLYHQEHVPLIVPLTLIKHYVLKYDQHYLKMQYYLDPHPLELRLRNHA